MGSRATSTREVAQALDHALVGDGVTRVIDPDAVDLHDVAQVAEVPVRQLLPERVRVGHMDAVAGWHRMDAQLARAR